MIDAETFERIDKQLHYPQYAVETRHARHSCDQPGARGLGPPQAPRAFAS